LRHLTIFAPPPAAARFQATDRMARSLNPHQPVLPESAVPR
jgi:hypothetical protein